MIAPDPLTSSPEVVLLEEIHAELERARRKFPGENLNLAALVEEVGELSEALLETRYGGPKGGFHNIRKEAVQVAAMAVRIALEGDYSIAIPKLPQPTEPL